MNPVYLALLNKDVGPRTFLRDVFPEIKRIESMDELKDVKLTEIKPFGDEELILAYTARAASFNFYANIRRTRRTGFSATSGIHSNVSVSSGALGDPGKIEYHRVTIQIPCNSQDPKVKSLKLVNLTLDVYAPWVGQSPEAVEKMLHKP